MQPLRTEIFRFGVVGGIGFATDASILYAAMLGDADPLVARLFSFATAVTVTWLLNRAWTFRRTHTRGIGGEYLSYLSVQTVGGAANFAVYALLISFVEATPLASVLCLAVGSLLGMMINFAGARQIVFKSRPLLDEEAFDFVRNRIER